MFDDYLKVDSVQNQIEEYLVQLVNRFPQLCTRVPLLLPSWQFRQYSAMRIGSSSSLWPRGILFCAGVHGDEKGGPEICLHFVEKLLEAYVNGSDLVFAVAGNPPKVFTAAQVATVMNRLKIFVLPLLNPDGRAAGTRKNARGVDLARNFDFLWDNPSTGGSAAHEEKTYRGATAESERETMNLVALVQENPIITRFFDIHTRNGGPLVAFHWGHDVSQSTNPAMNFTQASANNWVVGYRPTTGSNKYEEYIAPADFEYVQKVAVNMAAAINSVAGGNYPARPAIDYNSDSWGVSGVSTDYFFSRHVIDPSRPKIFGWLVEYGPNRAQTNLNPPFRGTTSSPPVLVMDDLIMEVNAGMMQACLDSIQPLGIFENLIFRVVATISDIWRRLLHSSRIRKWPPPIPGPN